ncbi:MAG: MBL fold metallo-hydrolase [Granulosicoccus sp.]
MQDLSGDRKLQNDTSEVLTTNFSVSPVHGATFYPQKFETIVADRVFLVSGLEFTDYYFIVSANQQELIAIDAGTRPDFAKAAYEKLLENVPDVPKLSSVFVTHSHWDHVGGHTYFRQLNPDISFYGRDNFGEEIKIMEAGPGNEFTWFFGKSFDFANVQAYRPDVAINQRQSFDIGGTSFETIPAPGSETPDAMFIYMPEERLLFVGDFIMPFSGAPFIEEGSTDALVESIDLIDTINPKRLLHGHQPLTDFFAKPADTRALKRHLTWLIAEARSLIKAGLTREEIDRQNLIPDSLLEDAKSQQFYLVMREQVINRLFDQAISYWEPELAGLDTLDTKTYGEFLSRYLAMDEDRAVELVNDIIKAGDYHLAERVLRWALAEWADSARLSVLQQRASLKLRKKYQNYNPFKFFLYSELANAPLSQF